MSSAFSALGLSSSDFVALGEGVGEGGVAAGGDDEILSSALLLLLVVTSRSPPGDICVTTLFWEPGMRKVAASARTECQRNT
jgi:hypothetical protein